MVILESIAVGVPVVATDVGDVRRVLDLYGAGICVPLDDPEAYRAACREVLADPEFAARLRANGEAAARDIDCQTMVDRYAELFSQTILAAA